MVLAYLDPAASGMVIQTIIAAAVALPIILRSHISRGMQWIRDRRPAEQPSQTDQPSVE
jgi:hypothetical protein